MAGADKEKIDRFIKNYASMKGKTEDEIKKSFEAILDKFCADGDKGREALKFLGLSERPDVDDFIYALAKNPVLAGLLKKKEE